jgi:hypothetical protein
MPSDSRGEFITAVCRCLPQSDLKECLPEGVIRYRDVAFFIVPEQTDTATRLSVVVDLGAISPPRRIDAYRHMAGYNLSKGAPEHGVLGVSPASPDAAVHRLFFQVDDALQPAGFARALHALATHALNFRANYGTRSAGTDPRFSRFFTFEPEDAETADGL